jgi:hypothetical protein
VIGLLVAGFAGAMIVLYAADVILKARARARRVRAMAERLTAAAARADQQQEQRQATVQASGALTSVLPAISRPPLAGSGPGAASSPGRPDRAGGSRR